MLAITSFYEDPLTVFVTGLILMILFFWYFATDIERRKRNVGTVLTVGVCALCILAATPLKERLKGGIDIVGGSSFSLRIQEREDGRRQQNAHHQGAGGPGDPRHREAPQQHGHRRAAHRPPGRGRHHRPNARRRTRGSRHASARRSKKSPNSNCAKSARAPTNPAPTAKRSPSACRTAMKSSPATAPTLKRARTRTATNTSRPILLNRRMALGGSDIANAVPSPQQADAVAITLNGDGTDKMIALTKNMQPSEDRIAIVLDGEVISAPVVNQVPLGKQFIIEGLREPGEVQSLANALMNPLENPLVVDEERTVSPTLGEAVVKQGIWAGIVGLAITLVFVLLYYRMAGIVALIGLAVNGIILFGVMAMFGFTFSLPGIAGMILTIGMAVDANVLIYERLREEIAAGKSLKNAIAAAYEKAFSARFSTRTSPRSSPPSSCSGWAAAPSRDSPSR